MKALKRQNAENRRRIACAFATDSAIGFSASGREGASDVVGGLGEVTSYSLNRITSKER